jgi:capsular polysaccharide biosynthesis protein
MAEVTRVALWGDERSPTARSLAGTSTERPLVLDPSAADPLRHGRLAGAGPFDLILDDAGLPESAGDRFRASFLHLSPGGRYRVPAHDAATADAVSTLTARLQRAIAPGSKMSPAEEALAAAIQAIRRDDEWLEVGREGRTLAKLREPEMNAALAEDPSRGRVVLTVPGVSFESRCAVRESSARPGEPHKKQYDAPELFLREYRDVVCRPKSVVTQRGLLTPDTFRHHQAKRLTHKRLRDAGRAFAVAPAPGDVRNLEGTYFHLDNEIRGFYGHATTEQISRVWAWRAARREFPDVRVLVSLNRGRPVAEWEWTLMAAAGIARDDVVVIDGPVRVERLLAATPMFSMPAYVHPEILRTWDEVGSTLRESAAPGDYPRRIFCSRRHDKRQCLNRLEVEELFAASGFTIVFPEDHPLPNQVEMFHRAEVIGGFAGSAMFTTMFTDRIKHLVMVTADTYRPSNEYMIASVRGHRLDVATGTTPRVLPPDVSPSKPLSWPFVVDMDAEGAWLREVLADL